MCEFLNLDWIQSVFVIGFVDNCHIPPQSSGFRQVKPRENVERWNECNWNDNKMQQEGEMTVSVASLMTEDSSKQKLQRRSCLRRNVRHKSLEDSSSTISSSPDALGIYTKVSHDDWSKKLRLHQENSQNDDQKLTPGLRRSHSEPSIPSCDKEKIVIPENFKDFASNTKHHVESTIATQSADVCDSSLVETVKPKKIIRHIRSRSDVPVSVLNSELSCRVHQNGSKDVLKPLPGREISVVATQNNIQDKFRRRSLLEDGCCSIVPQTECFFPQPHKGQSLTSFLSSEDFHTCAELDKENAHFYISEALIAAVEQIKCNQLLRRADEENEDESDEEICHLKQRIRLRRRERQRQREKSIQKNLNLLSDGRTDTGTTTSQSASSPQSSEHSYYSSSGTDDIDELELSTTCSNTSTLNSIQEKGLSLSMASLYSDADVKRFRSHSHDNDYVMVSRVLATPEPPQVPVSAEIVALCLLKKFTEKQLPKASDLEWLVSEQDAPQRLLPLPDSWPISPDDVDEEVNPHRTRLRGTQDWAPPRAQIIFSIHPESSRKLIVAKQKYRCAGCGMRIQKGYIHKIRFCKYLGKYFCHCCHSDSTAIIPGYVLHRWDFRRFPVSNFSRDLLERMDADPLFNISAINKDLFKKSRQLNLVRQSRLQLSSLKNYIRSCKNSEGLRKDLDSLPCHWITEPDIYSMQDLIQIKSGRMAEELQKLTINCAKHVLNCHSCSLQGFICEMCRNSNKIIFPFQLNKVIQCKECRTCFHKECYIPNHCPKCERIQMRKKKLEEESALFSSSDDEI